MEIRNLNVYGDEWVTVYEDGSIYSQDRWITQSNKYSTFSRFIEGKKLTPISNGKAGYFQVRVSGKKFYTHVLSYRAFHGEIPDGYEVDHIDKDKTNWKPDNLRLLTHKQNIKRIYENYNYITHEKSEGKGRFYIICDCGGLKSRKASKCKSCVGSITFDIQNIEEKIRQTSWAFVAKEFGISDNGLRKAYKRLSGKDPKLLKSNTNGPVV